MALYLRPPTLKFIDHINHMTEQQPPDYGEDLHPDYSSKVPAAHRDRVLRDHYLDKIAFANTVLGAANRVLKIVSFGLLGVKDKSPIPPVEQPHHTSHAPHRRRFHGFHK